MNVVMCNIDPALRNIILSQLVHFKLNLLLAGDDEKLPELLKKHQTDCLFYDVDIYDTDVLEVLGRIKNQPGLENLKLIILTANRDRQLLNQLFSLEMTGIIQKNTDYHDFMVNLKKVITFLELEVKKRVNRWVPPPEGDEVNLHFVINEKQRVRMKVIAVSVDGLKVEVTGRHAKSLLKSGPIARQAILFVNKKIFYIKVNNSGLKENTGTLLFADKKDVFLLELSSYIYGLLTGNREVKPVDALSTPGIYQSNAESGSGEADPGH